MMPPMPPTPPINPGQGPAAGGQAPASPMQKPTGGGDAQQKVLMGLAVFFMSRAHAASPMSQEAHHIAKMLADAGKRFTPPPQDIGQAEMKFAQSQYNPTGPTQPPQGAAPGMPPQPPAPPMAQAA